MMMLLLLVEGVLIVRAITIMRRVEFLIKINQFIMFSGQINNNLLLSPPGKHFLDGWMTGTTRSAAAADAASSERRPYNGVLIGPHKL